MAQALLLFRFMTLDRGLAFAFLLLFFSPSSAGCAKHAAPADGDWEKAHERYQQAFARNPEQASLGRKVDAAAAKVVEAHATKGLRAKQQGWMLDAGAHWGTALALCSPRVNPPACLEVAGAIRRDASALELSAGEAAKNGRWEEAAAVYDAILLVSPGNVTVAEKNFEVQRSFAASLQRRATDLQEQRLLGAAWAMNVRALEHDPMQAEAFRAGSTLEKSIRSRAKVAVQDVTVDAKKSCGRDASPKCKGDRFGKALGATIRPRLDDVKPYGPTRDPAAVKAQFKATVVSFDRGDSVVEGVEGRASGKTRIVNPAIETQQKKISSLKTTLAALQKQKNGPKKAKKIEATKKSLRAAKSALAAMPATVRPASWDLPWKEVTRSVEAVVRFELRESDLDAPLVLELTRRIERTDRTHRGDARHGVAADPLVLPSSDALVAELAQSFGDGASILASARDRRVKLRLEKGRARLAAGRREEALDAFVEVLFLAGPSALTDDAAAFVARSLERDEVETLVASN